MQLAQSSDPVPVEGRRLVGALLISVLAMFVVPVLQSLGIDGDFASLLCQGAAGAALFLLLPEAARFTRLSVWLLLAGLASGVVVFFARNAGHLGDTTIVANNGLVGVGLKLLLSGVVTPVFEEKFCRHVLFGGLRRHLNIWLAAFLVSALFAVSHPGAEILMFFFSLAMCALAARGIGTWDRALYHGGWGLAFWLLQIYYGYQPLQ